MLLESAKSLSFFLSMLCLYQAAIHAFFVPGAHWHDRLLYALVRLAFAACIALLSGLLFLCPTRTNPDRDMSLMRTPPVRLYLWGTAAIAGLFSLGWLLSDMAQQCGNFITLRTLEKL